MCGFCWLPSWTYNLVYLIQIVSVSSIKYSWIISYFFPCCSGRILLCICLHTLLVFLFLQGLELYYVWELGHRWAISVLVALQRLTACPPSTTCLLVLPHIPDSFQSHDAREGEISKSTIQLFCFFVSLNMFTGIYFSSNHQYTHRCPHRNIKKKQEKK